ncbi:MAG: ferredoxin family protein [Candidatus Bathyarchaeota archaeon]|nr:ferredoxin family protein [Candidatus Bathyarchaeota archaeon]
MSDVTYCEETYGVPRSQIPWSPTINYEKCVGCGKCVEYCHMGVYEFEEKNGKKLPVVKKPAGCVVFCKGCEEQCPTDAITHPSIKKTHAIIKKLQKSKGNTT